MTNFNLRTPSDRTAFANLVKSQFAKKGDTLTCAGIAAEIGASTTQVRNLTTDILSAFDTTQVAAECVPFAMI